MNRRKTLLILHLALLLVSGSELLLAQDVYFEEPSEFLAENRRFVELATNGDLAVLAYQEILSQGIAGGELSVGLQVTHDGETWSDRGQVSPVLSYFDQAVPRTFGITVAPDGTIHLATVDRGIIRAYRSSDDGVSFVLVQEIEPRPGGDLDPSNPLTTSNPHLFVRSDGGLILLAERYLEPRNRIVYSRSNSDGSWSNLELLQASPRVGNQWNASYLAHGGRDYIVYAGQNPFPAAESTAPLTFQLYTTFSSDAGLTWAEEVWSSNVGGSEDIAGQYNNRRPHLSSVGDDIVVVWERSRGQIARQVSYARMNADGTLVEPVVQASNDSFDVYNPRHISFGESEFIIGFNNPHGASRIVLLRRSGIRWDSEYLTSGGSSSFATIAEIGGRLHAFWHRRDTAVDQDPTGIVYLEPDQRADPPDVSPGNFVDGRRSRQSDVEMVFRPAPDASGILGYSYAWSQDPDAPVSSTMEIGVEVSRAALEAVEDGEWYFRIRSFDRAGNVSEPSTFSFYRDTTPPGRVLFERPATDEDGYLISNTYEIGWLAPEDDVVDRYSYALTYVATSDVEIDFDDVSVNRPSETQFSLTSSVAQDNADNGLWALSVRAVDSVGNVGEPAVLFFRMNKYVPVTQVWTIAADPDPLGRYNVRIIGRGYTANGIVSQIILDTDGRPPYDYVYFPGPGGYSIVDDRNISGPQLDNISDGGYLLGLFHTERGWYFPENRITLERNGTIKFGDFTVRYVPEVTVRLSRFGTFGSMSALVWVLLALMVGVAFFSGTRTVAVAREGRLLRLDARALISGAVMPSVERARRLAEMRRRGIGLRTKFAFFVVVVIASVVVMLAIGLGNVTLTSQRESLARSLKDRASVLIDSISAGAEPLLPQAIESRRNIIALSNLPEQIRAMEGEAYYATISGEPSGPIRADDAVLPTDYSYVWGTNDKVVTTIGYEEEAGNESSAAGEGETSGDPMSSLDRVPFGRHPDPSDEFRSGRTRIVDPVTELAAAEALDIDAAAREALGDLPVRIQDASRVAAEILAGELEGDLDLAIRNVTILQDRLGDRLNQIVGEVRTYPEFDVENFDLDQSDYIFWQPIVYRGASQSNLDEARYVHGVVRLGVATDRIVQLVADSRRDIIRITALIALAAVGVGIAGSLLLATIVVIPIRKLVRGVEHIRDTPDKEDLKDYTITIRTRDELFLLADTVNTMSSGLAEAAEAAKALRVTSDLQKKFIPLSEVSKPGSKTRKQTMAHLDVPGAEFHGYYEGADDLSGDYFTFERIDGERFAVIKCDVSGHGVNAAFIMVEVATIFLNRVREWRSEKRKPRLADLVTTVNDLLVERGFEDMFAAMTVGIFNTETGAMNFTHAGDREQRIYRRGRGIEELELDEAPATGMFSTDLFPPNMAYKEMSIDLGPGDIMILATDGIEESSRTIRDAEYREIPFDEEGQATLEKDASRLTPASTIDVDRNTRFAKEEFSTARMVEIVEQVQKQGRFVLQRVRSLDPEEELEFDYRGLEATAENCVLAVMAAEKIFRLIPDGSGSGTEVTRMDRIIDGFLKDRFNAYHRYFRYPVSEDARPDARDVREEYVYYTHLREEDQEDDLTILTVRKK